MLKETYWLGELMLEVLQLAVEGSDRGLAFGEKEACRHNRVPAARFGTGGRSVR